MNPRALPSGAVPDHAPGIETIAALWGDDGRPVGQADAVRAGLPGMGWIAAAEKSLVTPLRGYDDACQKCRNRLTYA